MMENIDSDEIPGTVSWGRFIYLEGLDVHGALTKAEKKELNKLFIKLTARDAIQ